MTSNRNLDRFNEHFYTEQLRDSRIGSLIVVLAFSVFLIADLTIYHYHTGIVHFRLLVIAYFLVALIVSFRLKFHKNLLRSIFDTGIIMLLGFSASFNIFIGIGTPQYHSRAWQVYIMIAIGTIIFAGLARRILTYALLSNLVIYLIGEGLVYGINMASFYDYFSSIFLTVMAAVFNHLFMESKYKEFNAQFLMQQKIDELRLEIRKRQVLEEKLKQMATYDALTNCYSRGAGLELLKGMMRLADDEGKPLSICFLDINNLKEVNDTYGHQMGDAYINEFVRSVKGNCRHTDICIRLGGDEFLLVLPETSLADANIVWQKIRSMMVAYSERHDTRVRLDASHGLAEYLHSNYTSLESFIDAADRLMYEEKKRIQKTGKS